MRKHLQICRSIDRIAFAIAAVVAIVSALAACSTVPVQCGCTIEPFTGEIRCGCHAQIELPQD